jgi:hypothetical protein
LVRNGRDPAEKRPSELVAKAQRYGWPGDANLVPVFLSVAGSEASDPGRVEAQRMSLAIEAVLRHDRRRLVMAGAETSGALLLSEGVAGKFRIRQVPDAPPPEEPGTAHLMVHQVGYDLMAPASPVSMGSLHPSALPALRRKSQIQRPGPRPGPDFDQDLPVMVLIPASGTVRASRHASPRTALSRSRSSSARARRWSLSRAPGRCMP